MILQVRKSVQCPYAPCMVYLPACAWFFFVRVNVGKYFIHRASGMDHPTTKIEKNGLPWLVGFHRQFLWNCVPIGSIFQIGIKIRNSHLTYLEWLRSKTWWVSSYNTINHIISSNLHLEDEYGTYKWKMNMEPTNHKFRKENDLPNLHDYFPC